MRYRGMVCLVVLALLAGALPAATFTVNNTNDSGPGSLRQAVDDANLAPGADTIDLTGVAGEIALTLPLPQIVESLTVLGPGAENLTLTNAAPGVPSGSSVSGAMFSGFSGVPLIIRDLRIADEVHLNWCPVQGSVALEMSGCVFERTAELYLYSSPVTLSNCVFRNILGRSAGAMNAYTSTGTILIEDCTFDTVTVGLSGDCIDLRGGTVIIRRSNFVRCTAMQSGATVVIGSGTASAIVQQCVFRDNYSSYPLGAGGLTFDAFTGSMLCEDTLFEGNFGESGGGLGLMEGTNTVRRCTFLRNITISVFRGGGGAFADHGTSNTFENCIFHGNECIGDGGEGGALHVDGQGAATMVNCTITGNRASGLGGGICVGSVGTVTLRNTVVAGNSAPAGPDLGDSVFSGGFTSTGFNFIGTPINTSMSIQPTDQVGTLQAPLDPMLGEIGYQGGRLPCMTPLPGSPLIDAGAAHAGITTDIRGFTRPVDMATVQNAAGGDGSDIGAVEVQNNGAVSVSVLDIVLEPLSPQEPSVGYPLLIGGTGLGTDITVTVTSPFQVSLTGTGSYAGSVGVGPPGASGNIAPRAIYVRYVPLMGSATNGTMDITAGQPSVQVALSADVPAAQQGVITVDRAAVGVLRETTSLDQEITISGTNLSGPIHVYVTRPFQVSLTPGSLYAEYVTTAAPIGGAIAPTTVYVRNYTGSELESCFLHFISPGAKPVRVPVSSGRVSPTITTPVFNCSFLRVAEFETEGVGNPSNPGSFALHPLNIGASATLSITSGPFEIAGAPGGPFGNTVQIPAAVTSFVYLRYLPQTVGIHTGVLSITGTGLGPVDYELRGHVKTPVSGWMQTSVPGRQFLAPTVGVPTTGLSYDITAHYLQGPITVTAPANFEVSLSQAAGYGPSVVTAAPVAGSLTATIWVRYAPSSGFAHFEEIVHADAGGLLTPLPVTGNVTPPYVVASTPAIAFSVVGFNTSAEQTYQVSGGSLATQIQVDAPPPFEVSLTSGAGFGPSVLAGQPAGGVIPSTTIYVRYNPTAGASHVGNLLHSAPGATSYLLALTGDVLPNGPIVLSATSLNFTTTGVGVPSAPQPYTVSGGSMAGPVAITAPPEFEVSLTATGGFGATAATPAPVGGTLAPTTIYVRYNPTAGMAHAGGVTHDSPNAVPVTLAVSGTVIVPVPTILASTTGLAFTAQVNTVSGVQSYTVSGMDLNAPIDVAVAAPFEVSLVSGSGFGGSVQTAAPVAGVVAATTIYVRYAPQVVGADTGDIVHDSTGANTVTILLTGTATAPPVQPPVQPPQDTPKPAPDNPACVAYSSAGWASVALLAAIVALQPRRRRAV